MLYKVESAVSDILIKGYKYEYPYLLTNLIVDICYVYYHIKMEYWIFSQVIVTYLDITLTQAIKLEKHRLESEKATIHYSRPYDFMDVRDREHILELFFMFGFMQSDFLENIFSGSSWFDEHALHRILWLGKYIVEMVYDN